MSIQVTISRTSLALPALVISDYPGPDDSWWLPGGMWTGITQVISGLLALALIVYSYRRFFGDPDAVAELESEIDEADEDVREHRHHRDG